MTVVRQLNSLYFRVSEGYRHKCAMHHQADSKKTDKYLLLYFQAHIAINDSL